VKRLELTAWCSLECELTHAEAAQITASGLAQAAATPEPGRWKLVSDSHIGVAIGESWELRISPRLAVPQLLFLLAYSLDPKGWKDELADFEAEPDLLDAVASGFSWHALQAIGKGLLHGYVHVDERLMAVRGRIRFGDQIARSATLPLPVEVSYDDYTADIPENRILKSGTLALLRLPRVPQLARKRLLKLRELLDEVEPLERPREVKVPTFTRLNERYRPALRLAELILRAASIKATPGRIASVAYVFDMNRVFEDFVSISLREQLQSYGGEVKLQTSFTLDAADEVTLRPDVVWAAAGKPQAIIDAKYKALKLAGMPNADAYQMLAYCTALGLDQGFLVYAKDSEERVRNLTVRNSTCKIRVRTLDVEKRPEELLGQVRAIVAEIAGERVKVQVAA
jgi:5-methylcytosine-specific restriction enzyme subunit McrC